jgi:hypothetical protein
MKMKMRSKEQKEQKEMPPFRMTRFNRRKPQLYWMACGTAGSKFALLGRPPVGSRQK